jgi:multiple sugar transport system permease protein
MSTIDAVAKPSPLQGLGTFAKYAVLVLGAFLTLGPVVWTVITALSPTDPETNIRSVGFSAFADVFDKIPFWLYFYNSALVTIIVAIGQMLSAAMAGYVFARFDFRGKNLLFGAILATMMVPMQVTIVPVFMLIRGMGLADTLMALILPALPTAFGTFFFRQYFMGCQQSSPRPPRSTVRDPGGRSSVSTCHCPRPDWRSSGSSRSTTTGTSSSDH